MGKKERVKKGLCYTTYHFLVVCEFLVHPQPFFSSFLKLQESKEKTKAEEELWDFICKIHTETPVCCFVDNIFRFYIWE